MTMIPPPPPSDPTAIPGFGARFEFADRDRQRGFVHARERRPPISITPETGIHGYLATEPRLTRSGGRPRFYARLGLRRRGDRRILQPDYLDLILPDQAAELAYELYRRGDDVIALGRFIPAGGHGRDAQFIAGRLAPDTNHLSVTIRRRKDAA